MKVTKNSGVKEFPDGQRGEKRAYTQTQYRPQLIKGPDFIVKNENTGTHQHTDLVGVGGLAVQ